ncbi:unnamed protein product [Closterium sp. NIES-54]
MVQQVLQCFDFTYSSPQATPLSTRHSLSALPLDESVEPSGPYPELVGCLMYLMTCTRPDLAYPLSIVACYVAPGRHRPEHMDAAKRVLRYLCSTSGLGLVLGGRRPVVLTSHANASWADDQATQRSSHGYTFSLGSGSVSWRSTRSSSVLGSSCEAEIYAGAMAAQELRWLTYLLTDLGEPPRSPPVLYVGNKAMLALCREHRTKHIALRYFLARELQQRGQLRLAYVASEANTADIFTKALPPGDHQPFCTMLGFPTFGGVSSMRARAVEGPARGFVVVAATDVVSAVVDVVSAAVDVVSACQIFANALVLSALGMRSSGSAEPGGVAPEGTVSGGAEPARAASGGALGAAGAGAAGDAGGATGATGGAGATRGAAGAGAVGAAGGAAGATGGAGAAGGAPGATGGAGAAGGAAGTGDPGAEGTGSVSAVFGGAAWPRPYFVPLLQQVLGSLPSPGHFPSPFLSPLPVQSQSQLQPASPLPGPSPYSGLTRGLTERREPESRPVRTVRAGRVSRPRLPPVPGTHSMTLRPSTAPQRVPLPSPPASSLPDGPDPESDSLRAASPTVTRVRATTVTDPLIESSAASALVAGLVDFAAACRLDYAASLVAESVSASIYPPSVGGECVLGTDILEDRQEDLECFAAASPHLVSMLLAPEGDPDALDIPTPRSYAEAIEGPYSSQWQAAMDAEMASWKSTGTYVDEVPPPGANILHSLDFSIAFLQGSLHEEIWLRRPPGFTGWFHAGTQWSLRRPVYGLRQAPREWHDTLRMTLAALGFAPSTADPSLFLRTDSTLQSFYVLVYVDNLVFATADTEALAHVKSELQKRHMCTDLGELTSYLGLRITRDRAERTISLTQSHMVQQVLQRFGFTYSSPQSTPLPTGHSLSALPSNESVETSVPYLELVGCLMYLMTCTRPDLAYPLSLLARYVAPGRHRKVHWDAAKRVLRYLCSTSGMGLMLVLTGHPDASWVDDLAMQRSSQGYTFSLGSGSVSWRSTRSSSVLSSSCKAEIYTGAMATQELRWLTYLLTDLGEAPCSPPLLYVNNKAMLALFGGTGAGGAGASGAGAVDPGAGGAGGTVQPQPYFVPLLQQPASPLPAPSRYTEQTGGLTERREPASHLVFPVPGTHTMALHPSFVPLRVPLPAPPESSLPEVPYLESDRARAASPTVSRLLTTVVTDPSFASIAASALVAELLDFAAAYRLAYAIALVAESETANPPSVGGECALGTDVLEDTQEDFECLAASVPRFASMLLAPEGDPDAPDIPTPRSYVEAITGPNSSQWQAAMDTEMASWKSTGTYVDEVPPPGANIVDGMWIFRVKRPPGSPPAFKARTQWSLRRPVYGLRQAPREWHDMRRTTFAALGFAPSSADPSLFLRTDTSLPPFYVLVYVDDLVFATAHTEALTLVKSELQKRHTCTDLGELRSYLGLQITRDIARRTITLTQSHMVHQVLQRFGFQFSSPQPAALSTGHSLSAPPSDESVEPSGLYPELIGCLMYLMTCTRPDLAYPLSLLARYVAPGRHRKVHCDAAKRVVHNLCSTSGTGLVLGGRGPVVLTGHADAS